MPVLTDQQLIDALVKRVQDGAREMAEAASYLPNMHFGRLHNAMISHAADAQDHRDLVAHLAGLLDAPTPERRAAALAALDLPQETR